MAAGGKFNLGQINYLLKNNFASTSTTENLILQTTIKTLTLTLPTL